jgi:hypothetical protein
VSRWKASTNSEPRIAIPKKSSDFVSELARKSSFLKIVAPEY